MERSVKILGIGKWTGIFPGCIMYYFTQGSFGQTAGVILGAVAGIAFWFILRKEQSRLISQTIASEIKAAIQEAADVDSLIEIKRLRTGILARVYLINAKDKMALIHKSVAKRMDACSLKKYLWIMQMTDMSGRNALAETQHKLNEQLINEVLKHSRGDKK